MHARPPGSATLHHDRRSGRTGSRHNYPTTRPPIFVAFVGTAPRFFWQAIAIAQERSA
jgi:hypothetical protein